MLPLMPDGKWFATEQYNGLYISVWMLSSLFRVNRLSFTVNHGVSKSSFPLSGTSWNMHQSHSVILHRLSFCSIVCLCFSLKRHVTLSMLYNVSGSDVLQFRGWERRRVSWWIQMGQLQDRHKVVCVQYYFVCSYDLKIENCKLNIPG